MANADNQIGAVVNIDNTSGIYQIRNKVDGKVYIGSAVLLPKRWREHKSDLRNNKHHSIKLQRAYNKYGEESFVFEILELVEDKAQLINREQYYIDKCDAVKTGYNINKTAGSRLGMKHSEKTKALFKKQRKNISEETRQKLSDVGKKRKLTEETRNKLKEIHTDMGNVEVICIELNLTFDSVKDAAAYFNKSSTAVSACCRGKQKTLCGYHLKYKSRETNKSKYHSVICLETNKIYKSVREAADSINRDEAAIGRCCKHLMDTAGGYHWRYLDEYRQNS